MRFVSHFQMERAPFKSNNFCIVVLYNVLMYCFEFGIYTNTLYVLIRDVCTVTVVGSTGPRRRRLSFGCGKVQ